MYFLNTWIFHHKELQKDLHLFRALPYASVGSGKYLESELSDILRHTPPRLPDGRLKRGKYKKSAFGGKKSPASPVQKRDYRIFYRYAYKIGKYKQVFPDFVTQKTYIL